MNNEVLSQKWRLGWILGCCYSDHWFLAFAHWNDWLPVDSTSGEGTPRRNATSVVTLSHDDVIFNFDAEIGIADVHEVNANPDLTQWPKLQIELVIDPRKKYVANWYFDIPFEAYFPDGWTKEFAPDHVDLPSDFSQLLPDLSPPPKRSRYTDALELIRQIFWRSPGS